MKTSTRRLLIAAQTEKDVEAAYRSEFQNWLPGSKITSPFQSDGLVEFPPPEDVRALLEFKYDWDMKQKTMSCRVLTQLVFYLKKFEQAGTVLPNVLFVGDRNECFVLSTESVQKFLDMKIDWTTPPSSGNAEMTRAMVEDQDITPYVFNVDDSFKFQEVLDSIRALAKGELRKVRATPKNIGAMFTYWANEVFQGSGLTAVEQADVFLKCLFGTEAYLHPQRKTLVVSGKEVPINISLYKSFFSHFKQGYKPSEIAEFYAQKDRLIEDNARRMQGAFFTPDLWVDEAHRMISDVLGPDWKDECIVWDPAAGTANLTRDYKFKDLIISTVEPTDTKIIQEQGYNPGASVFTYDFLNDDSSPFFEEKNVISDAVDKQLREAAKAGKRLVWLMNPPYGTANNMGTSSDSKAGIAMTTVNQDMKETGLGRAASQLYAQFMSQCNRLANWYGFQKWTVATFSVPTFMCSGSYKAFRDWWYNHYAYQKGMLFQASHFADVSGKWGISFTVWNNGKTDPTQDIPIMLKDIIDFQVNNTETKAFYNVDNREASKWVREEIKGLKTEDAPQMSSGLKIAQTGRGRSVNGHIGYFGSNGNAVYDNATLVYLQSECSSRANGLSIIPANFLKVNALYAVRKLVKGTWATDKDEYLAPTPEVESSDAYRRWNADAVVYALIHGSNNCTAMRDVEYKGEKWRIKNNYWWLTRTESKELYDTVSTPVLYTDIQAEDQDSYLATILPDLKPLMSSKALYCLDLLNALTVKSLPYRENYAVEHPDLHLGCHDAGVYQLKYLWREMFPEEWTELQDAFKLLVDKILPGVYDLGWLRR